MNEEEFPELSRILAHRTKTRKLYWTAAILFWIGVVMSFSYYIVPTGTVPSLIPGIFIISGALFYFVIRFLIKSDH